MGLGRADPKFWFLAAVGDRKVIQVKAGFLSISRHTRFGADLESRPQPSRPRPRGLHLWFGEGIWIKPWVKKESRGSGKRTAGKGRLWDDHEEG